MEIELWGNKLKLENNEIYNYRKIHSRSEKMDWCKITFTLIYGYLTCRLSNNNIRRSFFFHRLIYLFYNQEWDILNQELIIDHISRDKLDNRIENLRPVTKQENNWNTAAKGCSFHKKRNKWMAYITINRKKKYLGYYDTEEEAHEKYLEQKKIHHIISLK